MDKLNDHKVNFTKPVVGATPTSRLERVLLNACRDVGVAPTSLPRALINDFLVMVVSQVAQIRGAQASRRTQPGRTTAQTRSKKARSRSLRQSSARQTSRSSMAHIISAVIVIPLVTFGITTISHLQLWTQPLWLVLLIAPYIAVFVREPESLMTLQAYFGIAGSGRDFDWLLFGSAATIAFSMVAQIGEQVDFLRFMLSTRFPDSIDFPMDRLGRNIGGLLIGAVETTAQAVAQIIQEILRRPDVLKLAKAAIQADDVQAFDSIVWEALRFNPIAPYLFRISASDYTVAQGTERETFIPKGTMVLPLVLSAMASRIAALLPASS